VVAPNSQISFGQRNCLLADLLKSGFDENSGTGT
jgi:hypothetical protein